MSLESTSIFPLRAPLMQRGEVAFQCLTTYTAGLAKVPTKWMEEFSKRMLEDRILSRQAHVVRCNLLQALFARALL